MPHIYDIEDEGKRDSSELDRGDRSLLNFFSRRSPVRAVEPKEDALDDLLARYKETYGMFV